MSWSGLQLYELVVLWCAASYMFSVNKLSCIEKLVLNNFIGFNVKLRYQSLVDYSGLEFNLKLHRNLKPNRILQILNILCIRKMLILRNFFIFYLRFPRRKKACVQRKLPWWSRSSGGVTKESMTRRIISLTSAGVKLRPPREGQPLSLLGCLNSSSSQNRLQTWYFQQTTVEILYYFLNLCFWK